MFNLFRNHVNPSDTNKYPAPTLDADRSLPNTDGKMVLTSQTMILEKLSDNSGDDVSVTCLRVSLICPIGKARMVVPCRGGACKHLQCFDEQNFFKLNKQRPRWKCPVCDRHCPEDALITDTFLQDIIQKDSSSTEVVIHKDGSWSTPASTQKENGRILIVTPEDSTIKSTEVSACIPSSDTAQGMLPPSAETKSPEVVTDFIDLTLDNSDDDDVKFIRISPRKTTHRRDLFKRRYPPHLSEIQARNLQDMSTVDFGRFLLDLGIMLPLKKAFHK